MVGRRVFLIVEDMCGVWGAPWEDYDVAIDK